MDGAAECLVDWPYRIEEVQRARRIFEARPPKESNVLPIRDTIPSRRPPLATWTLILVNAGVFIFQLTLPEPELERLVYLFGVVPRRFVHPDWAVWAGIPADDPLAPCNKHVPPWRMAPRHQQYVDAFDLRR